MCSYIISLPLIGLIPLLTDGFTVNTNVFPLKHSLEKCHTPFSLRVGMNSALRRRPSEHRHREPPEAYPKYQSWAGKCHQPFEGCSSTTE